MKLAILGVTGGTGLSLLDQALSRGHHVVAVARRPERIGRTHERLEVARGDVFAAETLVAPFTGCDAVVSCVGVAGLLEARKGTTVYSAGTRSIVEAMRRTGVKRLLAVTSGGVEPQANDSWFYRVILKGLFLEPIYRDMRLMESFVRETGLEWTLVRPPYLTDGPLRENYRLSPDKNLDDGDDLSRESLAHFLLGEAENPRFVRRVVAIAR